MSSNKRFSIRVTKDRLVFCAGHFITFNGDVCERLHGHNYRVAIEMDAPLDENHYVFDFIALRDMACALVDELDHRMLLPDRNPYILLNDDGPNWKVTYRSRYWSFPKDECVVLPVPNTTAELLADYLAERLIAEIDARGMMRPDRVRVEVDESFGQIGRVERDC
ncbi:MAG: 6-pyruvoyl tetrahydropterin synthase family protein [Isosphaeraceae bacterium]|nr:6-pyruvoyl tetrahydropterin synthase family protein [Isosphaeraceae bacterium]